MADTYFRDPNTGTMVPLIGMTLAQADVRYAKSAGDSLTGPVSVNTPVFANHVARRDYVDSAVALPAGAIWPFAGHSIPAGWPFLLCQGQALSTTTYAALYAVLGFRYGGSGGTFSLPDLRGRVPAMVYTPDADYATLGARIGAKTIALAASQSTHNQAGNLTMHNSGGPTILNNVSGGPMWGDGGSTTLYHSHENPNAAAYSHSETWFGLGFGGGAHNNIQPYMAMHYMIKY